MNTRIMVETKDETSRLKALQREVEQLKKLLVKKDLDKLALDSYLKVAAENLGYKGVKELKKDYLILMLNVPFSVCYIKISHHTKSKVDLPIPKPYSPL